MIIATREGQVIREDVLTQEQKESAWTMIFRSFIAAHPDAVQTGGQEAAEASTGAA